MPDVWTGAAYLIRDSGKLEPRFIGWRGKTGYFIVRSVKWLSLSGR
jgi:hypothetical protein